MPTVRDYIKGDETFMTEQDKENLQNKRLTDSLLISCLAACEPVISRNVYLEKKWCHDCKDYGGYHATRLEWIGYREKLRSLLLPIYSMKMIIQMTKGCKDKATQREVLKVIDLIDKNDYELV